MRWCWMVLMAACMHAAINTIQHQRMIHLACP
jgi:hypothetical protein